MRKFMIGAPMRFFFLVASIILWLGIWLTGFDKAHWLLYLPSAFFLFAAITGICPGMIFSNALFGKKSDQN